MNMNFVQFATKYKVANKKVLNLPENVVPRIFPNYSSNPKVENFALHCKYQLLRYKPWITTQNNAWGDQETTGELLVNTWKEFLQTSYAQPHVPDWFNKLQTIIQNQNEPHDETVHAQDRTTRDEWSYLCGVTCTNP